MAFNANSVLVATAIGCLAVAGISVGGWFYIDSESRAQPKSAAMTKAAKVKHYNREVKPYRLNVMGYTNPVVNGRRMNSVPIMVKLTIAGSKGLRAVCSRLPHVKEAVLRTLSSDSGTATDSSGRLNLAGIEPQLRQEINKTTKGNPVNNLSAVMLSSGGGQIGNAREECQAALTAGTRRRS